MLYSSDSICKLFIYPKRLLVEAYDELEFSKHSRLWSAAVFKVATRSYLIFFSAQCGKLEETVVYVIYPVSQGEINKAWTEIQISGFLKTVLKSKPTASPMLH